MNISQIHTHPLYKFQYAQMQGCPQPDADHASAWSFQDEQIVRDRHWHMKPGDTVLDIGAAFGSYALPALAMGARVVAFSPADFDTDLLKINLALNPEMAKRCLIVRDGIYSGDGWFDPDHSTFVSDIAHYRGNGREVEQLPRPSADACWLRCRSLDSFLTTRPGIDRIDWIKMDIEGAEYEALKGAVECIRKWKPKLLIECHEFHVKDMVQRVHGFVEGLGLGYSGESHQHCAVSHSFFAVGSK